MPKHTEWLVICALSVLSYSTACADDGEAGFASLFNGQDLSGWEGPPDAWSVADGAIKCTGNSAYRSSTASCLLS